MDSNKMNQNKTENNNRQTPVNVFHDDEKQRGKNTMKEMFARAVRAVLTGNTRHSFKAE